MPPVISDEGAGEMKTSTLDPQIMERLGMIYGNHALMATLYSISTNPCLPKIFKTVIFQSPFQ